MSLDWNRMRVSLGASLPCDLLRASDRQSTSSIGINCLTNIPCPSRRRNEQTIASYWVPWDILVLFSRFTSKWHGNGRQCYCQSNIIRLVSRILIWPGQAWVSVRRPADDMLWALFVFRYFPPPPLSHIKYSSFQDNNPPVCCHSFSLQLAIRWNIISWADIYWFEAQEQLISPFISIRFHATKLCEPILEEIVSWKEVKSRHQRPTARERQFNKFVLVEIEEGPRM